VLIECFRLFSQVSDLRPNWASCLFHKPCRNYCSVLIPSKVDTYSGDLSKMVILCWFQQLLW